VFRLLWLLIQDKKAKDSVDFSDETSDLYDACGPLLPTQLWKLV